MISRQKRNTVLLSHSEMVVYAMSLLMGLQGTNVIPMMGFLLDVDTPDPGFAAVVSMYRMYIRKRSRYTYIQYLPTSQRHSQSLSLSGSAVGGTTLFMYSYPHDTGVSITHSQTLAM